MVFQLHFALWINAITPKLANLAPVKVGGFLQKMSQILDLGNLRFWRLKSQNPPTLTGARFASFGVMALIQSAKWSWNAILFDFQKFGTRRNFYRKQILVSKSRKNASKMTKNSDFEGNPVEISEVLPVEISTTRSGLISSFTGKNIFHSDA